LTEPQLAGLRVLLIEDEPLLALEVVQCLERRGSEIVGPINRVADALSEAEGEIDVAVLDVDLNGDPVWPVVEVLRERRVPFIFVTGFRRPDHIPAISWVSKPVQCPTLVAALTAVLRAEGK
jgi:DNA-binding response OmpR family regulator